MLVTCTFPLQPKKFQQEASNRKHKTLLHMPCISSLGPPCFADSLPCSLCQRSLNVHCVVSERNPCISFNFGILRERSTCSNIFSALHPPLEVGIASLCAWGKIDLRPVSARNRQRRTEKLVVASLDK